MTFNLTIETGNAAFAASDGVADPESVAAEVARILTSLAEDLADVLPYEHDGSLRDANGNTVGSWSYQPGPTVRGLYR